MSKLKQTGALKGAPVFCLYRAKTLQSPFKNQKMNPN
jgi:hypothetical protein